MPHIYMDSVTTKVKAKIKKDLAELSKSEQTLSADSFKEQLTAILKQIPHFTEKTITPVVERFGTVQGIMGADLFDFVRIRNVGRKRASILYDIMTYCSDESPKDKKAVSELLRGSYYSQQALYKIQDRADGLLRKST